LKLALIGDPVSHSRSPRLHNAFLREAGVDGSYVAIRVPRGNGIDVVRRMRIDGYTGVNVTTPLKEEVLRACDELDEEAQLAQAVNTIFFGRTIIGTNTDGIGACTALETVLGQPVALERIGVLGTGPTARAIFAHLRFTDAYTFVWGRDMEKVHHICERFEAEPWPMRPPEIVISTLPPDAKLPEFLLQDVLAADIVLDSNYGERSTLDHQVHREIIKGDLMLEAQARASFDYWLAHAQAAVEEELATNE
jgi:shikimate dehydrogenase